MIWYLFLQIFGENKFELEVIEQLDSPCLQNETAIWYLPGPVTTREQNQLMRLTEYVEERELHLIPDSINCFHSFEKPSLLLVDDNNDLRGIYDLTIREVDRAMVEIDLLMTLQNE